MSDYVATNAQEAPFELDPDLQVDYDFDFDFDFNDWINPMMLDGRPFQGEQSGGTGTLGAVSYGDTASVYNTLPTNFDGRVTTAVSPNTSHPVFDDLFSNSTALLTSVEATPHFVSQSQETLSPTGFAPSVAPQRCVKLDNPQRKEPRRRKAVLQCNVPGCEYDATFSRQWELQRHIRVKHNDNKLKPFVCGAQGCFRGRSPSAFARPDKLTAHIKVMHDRDDVFTQCPVKSCDFGPSTLETLGVHIQRAHGKGETTSATMNATLCKTGKCPVGSCNKYFKFDRLLEHIESHSVEDTKAALSRLHDLNLVVNFGPPAERQSISSDFMIQVHCPVCNTILNDIELFVEHMTTNHIYSAHSGGLEHFRRWKAKFFGPLILKKLLPWQHAPNSLWAFGSREIQCPWCGFSVVDIAWRKPDYEDKKRSIANHHLSLLRPEAEVVAGLYPHRMQILRLWPDFATHPVFSHFDKPNRA